MTSRRSFDALSAEELELIARYDGRERIEALDSARLVMVAPAAQPEDAVAVTIVWASGMMERPLPGSALWRAVLAGKLAAEPQGDPAAEVVRLQIRRSLERFPDLESWWHWVRTGWTEPPSQEPPRRPGAWGRWRRR